MEIKGVFDKFIWRDVKTSASIFLIKTKEKIYDERYYNERHGNWFYVLCKSFDKMTPSFVEGMPIVVRGCYMNRPAKGRTSFDFKVDGVEIQRSPDSDGRRFLWRYLSDDAAKVENVQDPVYQLCGYAPRVGKEPYNGLNGKSIKRMEEVQLVVTAAMLSQIIDSARFVTYPQIAKLCKQYRADTITVLLQNPYAACEELEIPFRSADEIAKKLSYSNEKVREQAAIREILKQTAEKGHTMIPVGSFNKAFNLLTGTAPKDIANNAAIISYKSYYASREYVEREYRVAEQIVRISAAGKPLAFDEGIVEYAESRCHIAYGKQQKEAFVNILSSSGIKVLTGGPGTGKTTVLNGILYAYEKLHKDANIVLCAPTGRAAQRMTEATGYPASTIHRLLGYRKGKKPAVMSADFVIVDEASMMDTDLFEFLLMSIKDGALLLLVGDVNQLESVGHGKILQDLLSCEQVISSRLTEVFRQKGGSPIVTNSYRINDGVSDLETDERFRLQSVEKARDSVEFVKALFESSYNPSSPFDMQVLCPSYEGESGIRKMNEMIQETVNPKGKCIVSGGIKYRRGDKVIMIKTNYDLLYFNGDVGVVTGLAVNGLKVEIRGEEFLISEDLMDDISLSYAMTIHKSQGSEFKNVVIVLPESSMNMLSRNLLYTAVTRAKTKVWIVTENDAFKEAVKMTTKGKRKTTLVPAVLEAAKEAA